MAGKKGLSGRKKTSDEQKRLRIIERSWDVIEEFLNSEAPLKERVKQAVLIAAKNVPQEIQGSLEVIEMPVIQKASGEAPPNRLDFNIGTPFITEDSGHPGQVTPLN